MDFQSYIQHEYHVVVSNHFSINHFDKLLDFVKTLKSTKKQTKRERQEAYVKESLTRALDEVEQAKREGRKLKTLDDFIVELEKEEAV